MNTLRTDIGNNSLTKAQVASNTMKKIRRAAFYSTLAVLWWCASSGNQLQVDTLWNMVPYENESEIGFLERQNNTSGSPAVLEARANNTKITQLLDNCERVAFTANAQQVDRQVWSGLLDPRDAGSLLEIFNEYSEKLCLSKACASLSKEEEDTLGQCD